MGHIRKIAATVGEDEDDLPFIWAQLGLRGQEDLLLRSLPHRDKIKIPDLVGKNLATVLSACSAKTARELVAGLKMVR